MLERYIREPEPREETFTEKLERYMQEPPDFRTEVEKRRDARQAASRREAPRPQTSPMERLLAQLEAERRRESSQRKERKPKTPPSKGQQKRQRDGKEWKEKQREAREKIRRQLDKLRKEFPVEARLVIAASLFQLGKQLAEAGATVMKTPVPGARITGAIVLIVGIAFQAAGFVMFLDVFGIFDWPEELPETPEHPTP